MSQGKKTVGIETAIEMLVISPGPARIPVNGERRIHRAVREMGDADLVEAISVRPDILDLLDEQARRDLERFQRFRNKPEVFAAHLAKLPQQALELLARHSILEFYTSEEGRRRRAAEAAARSQPAAEAKPAQGPSPEGKAGHTHSFEEIAARWLATRKDLDRARANTPEGLGASLSTQFDEQLIRTFEKVLVPALKEGPIEAGGRLYRYQPDINGIVSEPLRRGDSVRVQCPAEAAKG